jgi:signal transduction histidine kinase
MHALGSTNTPSRSGNLRIAAPTFPMRGLVVVVLAVAFLALLAWWDEDRESTAAFEDFSLEQATLAQSASAALATQLAALRRETSSLRTRSLENGQVIALADGLATAHIRATEAPTFEAAAGGLVLTVPLRAETSADLEVSAVDLLREARRLERPNEIVLLVRPPGRRAFVDTAGRVVESASIGAAFDANVASVMIGRPAAAQVGLPLRAAVAGVARVDGGPLGQWGVVVVAGARRERDRERRAQARLVISVVLAAGMVTLFGAFALRTQRKELDLAREIHTHAVERERDEALVRAGKIAMTGTFAIGIAHEIATPLSVIAGRAQQLLARTHDDARTERQLRVIVDQTARIDGVIRGFLDLARGGQPSIAEFDPQALAEGAVKLVEHRFEKARVALALEAHDGLPRVHGDRHLLEHALVNLLLNACEACPEGGHVVLKASAIDAQLVFDVIDDGAGITAEHAARALEPFFTTKPVGKGTGLGLAITNEIAKTHRGSLTIAANDRAGTRACLRIPIAPAVDPIARTSATDALESPDAHA